MKTESAWRELDWLRAPLPARGPDRAAALLVSGDGARDGQMLRPLHLNESPYPPSPKAVEAMAAAAAIANRYPDRTATSLRLDLAEQSGIAAERIVCAHGSEELIHAICALGVTSGAEIVVPVPTFPTFAQLVELYGGTVVRVPLCKDGANDGRSLTSATGSNTRILFACSPNPPSGGMMDELQIQELVERTPAHVLLVIDEAYHEYGVHAGGPNVLSVLAARRGPWVNLRTFSKAYSLAGARVGYAYCSSTELAETIRRMKTTYGPGSIASAGARASLADREYLLSTLDAVATERNRLLHGFENMGLKPYPSAANFVSVPLPIPAAQSVPALFQAGILVRDWRDPDFESEIRITVGLAEDTDMVLRAVRKLIADAPAALVR